MDRPTAIDAIKQRWLANWPTMSTAALGSPVAFSLDNVTASEGTYFARLRIKTIDREQQTMGQKGNRRFGNLGLIDVRISGPTNEGTKKLDKLAAIVGRIFESCRFGIRAGEMGITTRASVVGELTSDRQSPQSWIIQVVTPFEYTDVS